MSIRITQVRLSPPSSQDHEAITDLFWTDESSGESKSSTKAAMVKFIDGGGAAYVGSGASRTEVGVVKPAGRVPYVRTHADGQWNNNLLSLPRY